MQSHAPPKPKLCRGPEPHQIEIAGALPIAHVIDSTLGKGIRTDHPNRSGALVVTIVMLVDIGLFPGDPKAAQIADSAIDAPTGPDHWSMRTSKLRLEQVLHGMHVLLELDDSFWASLLRPRSEELQLLHAWRDVPHSCNLGLDFFDGMGEAHD